MHRFSNNNNAVCSADSISSFGGCSFLSITAHRRAQERNIYIPHRLKVITEMCSEMKHNLVRSVRSEICYLINHFTYKIKRDLTWMLKKKETDISLQWVGLNSFWGINRISKFQMKTEQLGRSAQIWYDFNISDEYNLAC